MTEKPYKQKFLCTQLTKKWGENNKNSIFTKTLVNQKWRHS